MYDALKDLMKDCRCGKSEGKELPRVAKAARLGAKLEPPVTVKELPSSVIK